MGRGLAALSQELLSKHRGVSAAAGLNTPCWFCNHQRKVIRLSLLKLQWLALPPPESPRRANVSFASLRVGLGVLNSMLGPTFSPMPEQASLFGSGVPLDSPLEGHSLWDLALITPGFARS